MIVCDQSNCSSACSVSPPRCSPSVRIASLSEECPTHACAFHARTSSPSSLLRLELVDPQRMIERILEHPVRVPAEVGERRGTIGVGDRRQLGLRRDARRDAGEHDGNQHRARETRPASIRGHAANDRAQARPPRAKRPRRRARADADVRRAARGPPRRGPRGTSRPSCDRADDNETPSGRARPRSRGTSASCRAER